jgi:hypothetical protein
LNDKGIGESADMAHKRLPSLFFLPGGWYYFPMASHSEQVIQAALDLDPDAQTELLDRLIDRLDPGADVGVKEAWSVEIDRRMGQLERGEVERVPLRIARARLKLSGGG